MVENEMRFTECWQEVHRAAWLPWSLPTQASVRGFYLLLLLLCVPVVFVCVVYVHMYVCAWVCPAAVCILLQRPEKDVSCPALSFSVLIL